MTLSAIRTFLNEPKYYVPTIGVFALISGLCLGLGHNGESCISGCAFGGAAALVIFIKYMKKRAEKEVARPNVQNVDDLEDHDVAARATNINGGYCNYEHSLNLLIIQHQEKKKLKIGFVKTDGTEIQISNLTSKEKEMTGPEYAKYSNSNLYMEFTPDSDDINMSKKLSQFPGFIYSSVEVFKNGQRLNSDMLKKIDNQTISRLAKDGYQIRAVYQF